MPPARSIRLTQREVEVALRIAHGDSNKTIAARLGLSEFTVRDHVSSLLKKSQTKSRSQLALKLAESLLLGVDLLIY